MTRGLSLADTTRLIDRRIRHAMRILENDQSPLPDTKDVAAQVGLSAFYFVRQFTKQVGMSPQDYGRSIVMMHSASRLRYSTEPIATVARDFGYAKQATFNKAFTRHFGIAPGQWRTKAQSERVIVSGEGVRLRRYAARRCLARRYFGPRDKTRAQWADFIPRLPPALRTHARIGFTYDDPRLTPPERIRHDCSVIISDDFILSGELADDGFEVLQTPAGLWAVAVTTPQSMREGYRAIGDGWYPNRPGYAFEGDPFLERYRAMPDGEVRISVCIRVRLIEQEGTWNMKVIGALNMKTAT